MAAVFCFLLVPVGDGTNKLSDPIAQTGGGDIINSGGHTPALDWHRRARDSRSFALVILVDRS